MHMHMRTHTLGDGDLWGMGSCLWGWEQSICGLECCLEMFGEDAYVFLGTWSGFIVCVRVCVVGGGGVEYLCGVSGIVCACA